MFANYRFFFWNFLELGFRFFLADLEKTPTMKNLCKFYERTISIAHEYSRKMSGSIINIIPVVHNKEPSCPRYVYIIFFLLNRIFVARRWQNLTRMILIYRM